MEEKRGGKRQDAAYDRCRDVPDPEGIEHEITSDIDDSGGRTAQDILRKGADMGKKTLLHRESIACSHVIGKRRKLLWKGYSRL